MPLEFSFAIAIEVSKLSPGRTLTLTTLSPLASGEVISPWLWKLSCRSAVSLICSTSSMSPCWRRSSGGT